jgi:hypothetical protein
MIACADQGRFANSCCIPPAGGARAGRLEAIVVIVQKMKNVNSFHVMRVKKDGQERTTAYRWMTWHSLNDAPKGYAVK